MSADGRCGPHCRYTGKCNSGRCNEDATKLTDADVETLRRAMVEAWQTWQAVKGLTSVELDDNYDVSAATMDAWVAAGRAWVAAKRARGGL